MSANSPPLSPSQSISLFTQLTEKSGEVYIPFKFATSTAKHNLLYFLFEFYSSKLLTKIIGPVAELGFEDLEVFC